MEECNSVISTYEGDQHVIAAAQHILKALAGSKSVSDDLRKTVLDLEIHLSSMSRITEGNGGGFKEVERSLKFAQDKVMSWEANDSMIWDSGSRESSEYLKAVDEIQTLTQSLQSLSVNDTWKQKDLLQRADGVLQIAMSRLEEELIHILVKHKQYFEPEYMSLHSNRVDMLFDESFVSVEDETIEDTPRRKCDGGQSEACTVDLVRPDIVSDLKSIANVMFASEYHQEFCQGFITSRTHALDEYIVILEMENLSIDNVLKMKWSSLNFEIKKWIRAMKIIVRVYLPSEKRLCNQILGHFGSVYSFCFAEISKSSMLHLLNFGEAIAMGTHTPEKLFRLLDMYEVLASLAVEVDLLFFEEVGSFVRGEFHKLLRKFGDTVRSTFLAFDNAIATNQSINMFPGGGVHHLTRYVMNYIKTLAEYGDTLNLLFADESPVVLPDIGRDISALAFSPIARYFQKITATLESNLSNKCRLYKDMALQHIFMMNNIHYIVQKVKDSELNLFFGDAWLRERIAKFQQDARNYERVTWSTALSLLREDSGSKANLKKKCTGFSIAFEEVYRTQTGWCIPDVQLRVDLQISISQKLVHAYRTFTGKNSSKIGDKWIKYNVDDLEHYILDLFEGSAKCLHHHQRKAKGLSFSSSLL